MRHTEHNVAGHSARCENHVRALRQKHDRVDNQIRRLSCCPASADRDLRELKRERLHLRDEIEKIRHDA